MPKTERPTRSPAEDRRERARRTSEEAMSIIDAERDAMRKKTERLRKLRLAQETDNVGKDEKPRKKSAKKRRT